ncbi:MAG: leucyl aminopeptidase [Deltaproteobacteria bacterium]|nr:leucyl aminopeptidase [Deltaproteobacteria bacterium]
MKVLLYTNELVDAPADLLAVGVFSDEPDRGLAFSKLNRALGGVLEQACRDEDFRGRPGQTLVFNASATLAARRVLVFGFGTRDAYDPEVARRFAGTAARTALRVRAASLALVLTIPDVPSPEDRVLAFVSALTEGARLGSYAFDTHRTRDVPERPLAEVRLAFAAEDVEGVRGAALRTAVERGLVVAEAVITARDLVNEPANLLTPPAFAERTKRIAKKAGLRIDVFGPRDLEKRGMGLLLGVAQGSAEEPRLVHLAYVPDKLPKGSKVIAFVGKGLTFDSGGLSIKDSEAMLGMKADMGGAAAVIGAMAALAELRPGCAVHGIVALAENMPDGRAIRPGDVLKSKRGLTVEVVNTDAEGRLVLADAIAFALELTPTELVDVATLTGACVVALGRVTAGAFTNDEALATELVAAWKASGEAFWRMPLDLELREQLKSDVADLKNLGERFGGAITAALFLREFVDGPDAPRWAHLDIAGPVVAREEAGYVQKGATGFGVRTLVELAMRIGAVKPETTG